MEMTVRRSSAYTLVGSVSQRGAESIEGASGHVSGADMRLMNRRTGRIITLLQRSAALLSTAPTTVWIVPSQAGITVAIVCACIQSHFSNLNSTVNVSI